MIRTNKIFCWTSLLICICLIFTGCWDKIEINDRAFVMGLGLDKTEKDIIATYAIPNLPVITGQGNGGEKNFLKKTVGKTLLEANEKVSNISNTKITFDHTKVIVLGDQFLEDPDAIKMTFDYFARSPEYSLSLLLVATDGQAAKLLEAKPNADEPMGIYASEIFEGNESEEMSKIKTTLIDFISGIEAMKGVGIVPILNYKEKEVIVDGLIVLKDYKKCCRINQEQIMPFNWLRGIGKGIYVTEKETLDVKNISYKISEIKRKITFKKNEKGIDISIKIMMEGDIIEFKLKKEDDGKNIFSEDAIKEVEKAIQEGMENEANKILDIAQKEVGEDILEISNELKIQDAKLWEEIKDNWSEYFTSANIKVEIIPNVRRIGMTK